MITPKQLRDVLLGGIQAIIMKCTLQPGPLPAIEMRPSRIKEKRVEIIAFANSWNMSRTRKLNNRILIEIACFLYKDPADQPGRWMDAEHCKWLIMANPKGVEFDTKFPGLSCEKYSLGNRQSEITTVHRALCLVMQEFENHEVMEEGILRCLLPSNLPSAMFDEEGQDFLLNYVSSGVDTSPARMQGSRRKPLRRLSVTVIGRSTSQLGRAELLKRNANGLITVF